MRTSVGRVVSLLLTACVAAAACGSGSDAPRLDADGLNPVGSAPVTSAFAEVTGGRPVVVTSVPSPVEAGSLATAPASTSASTSPGQGAAVPGPIVTARPAAFPLRLEEGRRHLVGADGEPYLLLGDAAWSLIAELDEDEVASYLSDRKSRGFNTVLVSLIEHHFSSDPPNNAAGDQPFVDPGDFSTPNESYFRHVDRVLERMAAEGFVVLLSPDYAGWGGGDEGWWAEMQVNSVEALREYGRFLGARYARFDNIVWVNGGDFEPEDKERLDAVALGIRDTDPDALQTAHLAGDGVAPRDYWSDASWLDLDNVYADEQVYEESIAAYTASDRPFFLLEGTYENEHDVSIRELRTQAYQALFSGATGHVFGNNPIWHFSGPGLVETTSTWQEALDGPGSRSMAGVARFMTSIAWWQLRPDIDGVLVVDGRGSGRDHVAAAVADDATWAVAYLPSKRSATIDLSVIAGDAVHLTWVDPATGLHIWEADVGTDGPVELEWPGGNSTGDDDWVVVIEAA